MGISYDPVARKWTVVNEKTDYPTNLPTKIDTIKENYPTNLPTTLRTDFPTNHNPLYLLWKNTGGESRTNTLRGAVEGLYVTYLGRNPSEGEIDSWRKSLQAMGWVQGSGIDSKWFKVLKDGIELSNEAASLTEMYFLNDEQNKKNKATNEANAKANADNAVLNEKAKAINEKIRETNKNNAILNTENSKLNQVNSAKNKAYNTTMAGVSTTMGGDYIKKRDPITQSVKAELLAAGVPEKEAEEFRKMIEDNYKAFYRTEKLQVWDSALGAKPPYGTFDPEFYKNQNPNLLKDWQNAVKNDDIDITERYGENNFYYQHYTNVGKGLGLRGNKQEDTKGANIYLEKAPTDQEIQQIRDLQLGVDRETIAQRILNIPAVSNEWTKARNGDPYWKEIAKENYLDVNNPDDFAVLFRLSDRPEDKQIALNYSVNVGGGITELEDAINQAIGAKAEVDIKKFAALNQTILKDTIAEMKRVRGEQEMLSFYRGFSGFAEVVNINEELANSILGDTGVGGILSFTSGGKAEESLMKSLRGLTGMGNNVAYNWQQWFDKAIKEKYGIDYSVFEPLEEKKDIIKAYLKEQAGSKPFDSATNKFNQQFLNNAGFKTTEDLIAFLNKQGAEGQTILNAIKQSPTDTSLATLKPIQARIEADIKVLDATKQRGLALSYQTADKTEMMNIEAQFARDYIDQYLMPRFNTSRSMDEFVDYLDVRQEEQNPFQTQDTYNAIKSLSDLYTKKYLDDLKGSSPRSFNPEFYFDPKGDISRADDYAKQKAEVSADWEAAKKGDPYWAQQAYRFGVDINNKAAFARMHFEVRGQGKGYDAAEDIVNAGKVKDFLYQTVLPALKDEALKQNSAFGQFITPEEFAEEMLRGLDPANTPEKWDEILERYGLGDFKGTADELKQYIAESLRTGSARDIREQIKFLNEKRQRPTQEILGVTYIDRPEDYKNEMAKPTTQLYAIFQSAGYQGTEDEFYENMFPDLDRSEQVLLTKGGKGENLEMFSFDFKDPFASLGTLESFFPEDQKQLEDTAKEKRKKSSYESYFRIGDEEDDEEDRFGSAQSFLGEFTSLFKGL